MRLPRFKGLSSKIFVAFLITAAVPVMITGLVGIYYSLEALREETLYHLDQEVTGRATNLSRFFDLVTGELILLTNLPVVADLADALGAEAGAVTPAVRERVERSYSGFVRAYPYIYQVRFIGTDGKEIVRIDRRGERPHAVPWDQLQDKSDRYYVHEGFALEPGQVYVSPLDLNIERGEVEVPERPVIRFATPMPDRNGKKRGLVIINLHAEFMLQHIQEMAGLRGGKAFLFDRSGFFVSRSSNAGSPNEGLRMESVEALASLFPRRLLNTILRGGHGTEVLDDWIIAYAPILVGRALAERSDSSNEWVIASAFPRARLFEAVFNLYFLYVVLAICLVATAAGGFLLSRHLLRPVSLLAKETEEIAKGNFGHRVEITGDDEITDLGRRFNAMAADLDASRRALHMRQEYLEEQVAARTAALEQERQNLETVIRSTADAIVAFNADGIIELANPAAERCFAQDTGILAGKRIDEVWPEWSALAAGTRASQRVEAAIGGRIHSITVSLLTGPEGRAPGHILVARDVTDERRLADQRRELDRQMFQHEKITTMGEVAMGLAHEIGNPLAGMKAVVQALREEDAMSEHVRTYLGRFEKEVDRLSAFLRTFHGFAAPQDMHPVACRLEDVLEDVLLWTRKDAKSRGISIGYRSCGQDVPALWADPNQLKQVLLNLVINAVNATDKGGEIKIGMCAPETGRTIGSGVTRLRFCIEDNGPGIAPEVLPRIFEPFFTTRANGSGLGLAVVKKIATQHGADIRVYSEPGRGTRIEFAWPVAEEVGGALPQFESEAPGQRKYG